MADRASAGSQLDAPAAAPCGSTSLADETNEDGAPAATCLTTVVSASLATVRMRSGRWVRPDPSTTQTQIQGVQAHRVAPVLDAVLATRRLKARVAPSSPSQNAPALPSRQTSARDAGSACSTEAAGTAAPPSKRMIGGLLLDLSHQPLGEASASRRQAPKAHALPKRHRDAPNLEQRLRVAYAPQRAPLYAPRPEPKRTGAKHAHGKRSSGGTASVCRGSAYSSTMESQTIKGIPPSLPHHQKSQSGADQPPRAVRPDSSKTPSQTQRIHRAAPVLDTVRRLKAPLASSSADSATPSAASPDAQLTVSAVSSTTTLPAKQATSWSRIKLGRRATGMLRAASQIRAVEQTQWDDSWETFAFIQVGRGTAMSDDPTESFRMERIHVLVPPLREMITNSMTTWVAATRIQASARGRSSRRMSQQMRRQSSREMELNARPATAPNQRRRDKLTEHVAATRLQATARAKSSRRKLTLMRRQSSKEMAAK